MDENEIKERFLYRMDNRLSDYEKCVILSELSLKNPKTIMQICGVKERNVKQGQPYDVKLFIKIFNRSQSVAETADFFHISKSTVHSRIRQLSKKGVILRETRNFRKLSKSEIDGMIEMYYECGNYSKVAKRFNVCVATVCNNVRKSGAVVNV